MLYLKWVVSTEEICKHIPDFRNYKLKPQRNSLRFFCIFNITKLNNHEEGIPN